MWMNFNGGRGGFIWFVLGLDKAINNDFKDRQFKYPLRCGSETINGWKKDHPSHNIFTLASDTITYWKDE